MRAAVIEAGSIARTCGTIGRVFSRECVHAFSCGIRSVFWCFLRVFIVCLCISVLRFFIISLLSSHEDEGGLISAFEHTYYMHAYMFTYMHACITPI